MNDLVTSLLLICAATTFAAALVVAQRRLVADVARRFVRLPRVEQALLVVAVGVMTVCAQKSGTNEVSNAENEESQRRGEEDNVLVERRSGETPLPLSSSASSSLNLLRVSSKAAVTTNDIARGYAFVEARTNATVSYAMPTNGTVVGTWHKTGAYEDVVRARLVTGQEESGSGETPLPLWGDVCVTSLWAYTWGKVRPRLRDKAHEIVAVGAPMSCVPGEGRLWAATTNGSWLITWENFRAGRRAKNISAQIELFANGDFITRSNDVERVYRRVNPDDWDDDGISNEIDDDPLVAAETLQFGPQQALPDGANESAYYWIDLVVSQANAKVTFSGDGASNLADPSFIAKAGETNRVTLLIGKPYVATCAFPFEIVGQSSVSIESCFDDDNRAADICWPVKISVVGQNASNAANAVSLASDAASVNASVGASASTASFTMSVEPACLDGVFAWTNVCCSISGGAFLFSYSCRSSCPCTGCSSSGYYVYEGHRIGCVGGTCGCLPSGGPPQESEPASVSVSFSKNAIIFEDAYEASEGVTIARRSTRTTLVCSANGGAAGGVATFEIEGSSRLTKISGRSLPFSRTLGANETFSTQIIYEGRPGSGVQPKVTAKFVSDDSKDFDLASSAELTVAQVEIVVHRRPSANESAYRHKLGICEVLSCNSYPSDTGLQWIAREGCLLDSDKNYQCPSRAAVNPLKAVCGDAEFVPQITVVEPESAEGRDPRCITYEVSAGHAGWIGLHQDFHIRPLDVSFEWLKMEEVPCTVGERQGYFSDPSFAVMGSHTEEMGAGVWCEIGADNRMGEGDDARITMELMRIDSNGNFTEDESCGWSEGSISWDIPFGWTSVLKADRHANAKPEGTFDSGTKQRFAITATGSVFVEKFGNTARRDIDGRTYCNGVEEGGLK